jgi:hypothetical protein
VVRRSRVPELTLFIVGYALFANILAGSQAKVEQ